MKNLNTITVHSLLLSASAIWSLVAAQKANQTENPILLLSEDEAFHFELLVPLGEAIYNGADIGAVLGVAKNIIPGDLESFSNEFYALANKTKAAAEDPANAFDALNVQSTWFQASTYFRRADFYLHGNWDDARINELWNQQLAAFDKGMASTAIPGQRIQIPTADFDVEAIWYPVSKDNCTKRPTIILGNGYDGSQEDMYHTVAVPALARGWNVITYEGPGQPSVRRFQNKGFIPDWERVVTPVVDYLLSEHSNVIDTDRLVLFGYSFNGYLSARAAAFEPRLSAVLVNGGIYNVYESFSSQLPPQQLALLDSGNKTAFDAMIYEQLAGPGVPTTVRWGIEQGLWSFNTKSPYDWLQQTKQYTLEGITDLITMPLWTADSEFEGFFAGQSRRVKDAMGDRATYHLFNGTAGYHCQVGAAEEMTRTMFAWLNQTLG